MVHKLLLLRTPTRKSRRVWDQEISGARTEAPGLLYRDLSIVELEIHSENVEHPVRIGWSSLQLENEVFWIFTHLRKKPVLQQREIRYPTNRVFSKKERSINLCLRKSTKHFGEIPHVPVLGDFVVPICGHCVGLLSRLGDSPTTVEPRSIVPATIVFLHVPFAIFSPEWISI